MKTDGVIVAIRTKREQPSLGWKVASMLRRSETRVRNELGWRFTNAFGVFPQRGLKTLQRLVNICIQIQESLSRMSARPAMQCTIQWYSQRISAALRPQTGKRYSDDLEYVPQSNIRCSALAGMEQTTHAHATVGISLLAMDGTARSGRTLLIELCCRAHHLLAILEETLMLGTLSWS